MMMMMMMMKMKMISRNMSTVVNNDKWCEHQVNEIS
jgi:hypothetical protein